MIINAIKESCIHLLFSSYILIFVKGYRSLYFVKNMGKEYGKNISKNLSSKYSQKRLHNAKQSVTDALKTASRKAIKNSRSNF